MADSRRQKTLAGFDLPETAPTQPEPPPVQPAPKRPQVTPGDVAEKTVYVIDSHSLIFQVFHALPEMSSPSGEPVGAVFGFMRDMLYLLEEKKPDFLICAFDLPGGTFRHELYDQYKAGRGEMPDDLRPQIPAIREMMEALAIPCIDCENYEADDILATIARQVDELDGKCLLVTGDKDARQLITDNVGVYNLRKDEVMDAQGLWHNWGVRPDQVVDYQSLVGDSVDNVPGVALIGPKIARELLEKYETLEGVLDNASELSGKKRKQNLLEGRDVAMLSRELVRLVSDVPVEIEWSEALVGGFDQLKAVELCRGYGFRGLTQRVEALEGAAETVVWEADYQNIDSADALRDLVAKMQDQTILSLDTETTSVNPRWAEIVGYSFCWKHAEAYYVPVRGPQGSTLVEPDEAVEILRPVLENPEILKVGQNLKYDMVVLRGAGIELAGARFDTMVADYLLEAGERNHGMNDLSRRYLRHDPIPISDLIGKGKKQIRMDEVPVADVVPYAAEDANIPLRLMEILESRLDEENLRALFDEVEMPLIEVLVEMEFNGICVDAERLTSLSKQYETRLAELEKQIYELAGRSFNIASPKQLGEVLFTELGLPVIKKTKTGASTDSEVLEQLAKQHDLPVKIIEYRQYAKLKGTYLDALVELIHPQTGRVHTSLNQVVAATGRLSSNDPNLQNIPVRTEAGREIRSAFRPGQDDWVLLAADYSQIELRVLAHFSQDPNLLDAFKNGEDIHSRVASEVYETPLEDVTSEMRRSAKAINFGIIYGQSPFGLAKALDIDREDAATFIDAYFAQYEGVEVLMEKILEEARSSGYVSTILGRRRSIQGIRSAEKRASNPHQQILPERTAINTVIQGSAADIIKRAMIDVLSQLRASGLQARMLLQIHDELLFEVPPHEVTNLAELVRQGMGSAMKLDVPLVVDVKSGPNWSACEPLA